MEAFAQKRIGDIVRLSNEMQREASGQRDDTRREGEKVREKEGLIAREREREREVVRLSSDMRGKVGPQRAHQSLPRHLRRRTMSHNTYKLPSRLRRKAAW